jgi:hypothetical protein
MHATILRDNPDRSVVIEGHADERGTREYNLALGERRADAVRSFPDVRRGVAAADRDRQLRRRAPGRPGPRRGRLGAQSPGGHDLSVRMMAGPHEPQPRMPRGSATAGRRAAACGRLGAAVPVEESVPAPPVAAPPLRCSAPDAPAPAQTTGRGRSARGRPRWRRVGRSPSFSISCRCCSRKFRSCAARSRNRATSSTGWRGISRSSIWIWTGACRPCGAQRRRRHAGCGVRRPGVERRLRRDPAAGSGSERDAYAAAFELMRQRQFDASIRAFRSAGGRPIPTAIHGQRLLLARRAAPGPGRERTARQAFAQVVNLYPDHQKVPDTLYKLGVVYHRLGDVDRGPGSTSTACAASIRSRRPPGWRRPTWRSSEPPPRAAGPTS